MSYRVAVLVVFTAASFFVVADAASAFPTMRVACRFAQPPFNYHPIDITAPNAKCQGMLADIFYMIMDRAKLDYTMTFISTNSLDPLLQLSPVTNRSTYDMIISFHTVTPARLLLYPFTTTLFQSLDQAVLAPKYMKKSATLIDSVIRTSVLYILLVIGMLMGIMGTIIFIFEHFEPDGDMMQQPPWRRYLWAMEMGVETLLTSSSSGMVLNPVTRFCRSMFAIFGIFMMGILGGALTSQLTTAGVADTSTAVTELRGANLKIASGTLKPFLESLKVGAKTTVESDMEVFARRFYAGLEPNWDGFVTSTTIANFFDQQFRPSAYSQNITLSKTYTANGSPELKAMPLSFTLSRDHVSAINSALQSIRDDRNFSTLLSSYIKDPPVDPFADDMAIDADAYFALYTTVSIVFGLLIVVALLTYLLTKFAGFDQGNHNPTQDEGTETVNLPPTVARDEGEGNNLPFYFNERVALVPAGSVFAALLDTAMLRATQSATSQ